MWGHSRRRLQIEFCVDSHEVQSSASEPQRHRARSFCTLHATTRGRCPAYCIAGTANPAQSRSSDCNSDRLATSFAVCRSCDAPQPIPAILSLFLILLTVAVRPDGLAAVADHGP